ncbi:MAG: hypothetical protein KF878_29475 [Planctomycetes bacterium]|nr:hypothetical protein [Planctomycetota bacterium]
MTTRRTALGLAVAASAALLVTLGCQVLPPAWGPLLAAPPRGEAVTITGPAGDSAAGRAAVVGADLVLTVRHVLPATGLPPQDGVEAWVFTGRGGGGRVPGRVVGAIPARPEPVLVVRVDVDDGPFAALVGFPGFSPDRRYVMGAGPPEQVETARGRAPLLRARLRPGDSGSPVLDASGGLVGLLCGVRDGVPALAPIRGADLRPYERRLPPAPAPIDLIARAWPGAARGPRGP